MPSVALQEWFGGQSALLDEIENAHRAVGGSGPGRRYATQQINHAYAVLLSAQFQRYCRDFHSACVFSLVSGITPAAYRGVLRKEFLWNCRLDRGNSNPGNIAADFNRLGIEFWLEVEAVDAKNAQRRQLLEELNEWRNAIAHQDFPAALLRGGRPVLHLAQVQGWRKACDGLVRSFDLVMGNYIRGVTGTAPW
jgi:hypothetical protein